MLRLFDTHCHFETTDLGQIQTVLERARAAGVERLMAVGGSPLLNEAASVAASFTGSAFPVVMLAQGLDRDQADAHAEFSPTKPLSAWGEIGLDYHYSPQTRSAQLRLFAAQLEEARRRELPVIIHTREADDDTLGLLRELPSRGVIHCYTGTPDFAQQLLDLGFYISISGIVTFKSAENVRETARMIPDDRILIETDAPFLAPVPQRGNPNEPAFVRHTCEFLAELRGRTAADFAEMTYMNGERAFAPTTDEIAKIKGGL